MKHLLLFAIAAPICWLTTGVVAKTLWGWFVVPVFGLPALTILQALGISFVISVFINRPPEYKKDEPEKDRLEKAYFLYTYSVCADLFILMCGFLIHSMM